MIFSIIAIAWLIAMNVPSWLPITGALYQDMTITVQEKDQLKGEMVIEQVRNALDQCEAAVIQDVFVDSIYDAKMRSGAVPSNLCSEYMDQYRKQYTAFKPSKGRRLTVPQKVYAADAQARSKIIVSARFKKTTTVFLIINAAFLLLTLAGFIIYHTSQYQINTGVWLLYFTLYSLGALTYGVYMMPYLVIKHETLSLDYLPTMIELNDLANKIMNGTSKNLSSDERALKGKIQEIESHAYGQMQSMIRDKQRYFNHYDLYWIVTHNDMLDYHYIIKPYPNGNPTGEDTLTYNPCYFDHTSRFDPEYPYYNNGSATSFHSFLKIYGDNHPGVELTDDQKSKIRGDSLEYSTFIQILQRDTYAALESGVLIPYPGENDGLLTGRAHEYDLIYINRKGVFVFECKNLSGTLKGDLYDRGDNYAQYLQYRRPGEENFQKMYNPLLQNKSHIRTLLNRVKSDVYHGHGKYIPYYNIVVTSDCLDINGLNYQRKSDRPIEQMYWVRYGKIGDWFKKMLTFKDKLEAVDINLIDNYLKQWRCPTDEQLNMHNWNNKKIASGQQANDNFFV